MCLFINNFPLNMQGYFLTQASFTKANSYGCPCTYRRYISYSYNQQLQLPLRISHSRVQTLSYFTANILKAKPWGSYCVDGCKRVLFKHKQVLRNGFCLYASLDVASAVDVINDLGLDTLTFLAVTVLVVPGFKIIKASPVSYYADFFSNFICFEIIPS